MIVNLEVSAMGLLLLAAGSIATRPQKAQKAQKTQKRSLWNLFMPFVFFVPFGGPLMGLLF
jgi:hypothetical protein